MADLKVKFTLEGFFDGTAFKNAEKSIKSLEKRALDVTDRLNDIGKGFRSVGKSLSLYVTGPLTVLGGLALRSYDQQLKAVAQIEAGLKSTGNAAKLTSRQLQQAATDLQKTTLFAGGDILSGVTQQLVNFTNISGSTFLRAQEAVLDLATRMDGDLSGAAMQVGKALNDPIQGMTALSKIGIEFTVEQQRVIKALVDTNRVAEAQAIILTELETRYGGAAAAAAQAGLGPLQQLKNTLGDVLDEIGMRLMPLVNAGARALQALAQRFLDLDKNTKNIIFSLGLVAAAIGPVVIGLGIAISSVALFTAGLIKLKAFIATQLVKAFGALVKIVTVMFSPTGLVIVGVAAVLFLFTELAGKIWYLRDRFGSLNKAIDLVIVNLTINFELAITELQEKFQGFLNWISRGLKQLSRGKIDLGVFDLISDNLEKLEAYSQIRDEMLDSAGLTGNEQISGTGYVIEKIKSGIDALYDSALSAKDSLVDLLSTDTTQANGTGGGGGGTVEKRLLNLKDLAEGVGRSIGDSFSSAFEALVDGTTSAADAFKQFAVDAVRSIFRVIQQQLIAVALQSALGSMFGGGAGATTTPNVGTQMPASNFNPTVFAAGGGEVRGPGTGTSDSIRAMLSDGEYVNTAKTVQTFGVGFFDMLRSIAHGRGFKPRTAFSGFADGGQVSGGGSIQIINQGTNQTITDVVSSREGSEIVTKIFLDDLAKNGRIAKGISNNYNINRRSKF